MSEARIVVRDNASLRVYGPVTLVDAEGTEIPVGEGEFFALCRCGASRRKPFCDGAHRDLGFDSICRSAEVVAHEERLRAEREAAGDT
ncbi:MAG: CDGSH iron-sulfur domain-containing protein [Candidatus Dormibacteria bacterium]